LPPSGDTREKGFKNPVGVTFPSGVGIAIEVLNVKEGMAFSNGKGRADPPLSVPKKLLFRGRAPIERGPRSNLKGSDSEYAARRQAKHWHGGTAAIGVSKEPPNRLARDHELILPSGSLLRSSDHGLVKLRFLYALDIVVPTKDHIGVELKRSNVARENSEQLLSANSLSGLYIGNGEVLVELGLIKPFALNST
jgi:hypothetical protein